MSKRSKASNKEFEAISYEHSCLGHANIFRPVIKNRPEDVIIETKVGTTNVWVKMDEQLNYQDQDLLYYIYNLAKVVHHLKVVDPEEHGLFDVFKDEELKDVEIKQTKAETILIKTTRCHLLEKLGLGTGGKDYKQLKSMLDRLWGTRFKVDAARLHIRSSLMSWSMNSDTDEVIIVINPLTAKAIFGDSRVSYIRHNWDERMTYPVGLPRGIHGILSGNLNKQKGSINLLELGKKIYGNFPNPNQVLKIKLSLDILCGRDKCDKCGKREANDKCDKCNRPIHWEIETKGRASKSIIYFKKLTRKT